MSILSEFDYTFDSSACESCGGKCCTGESGYIWINDAEIEKLSEFMGIDKANFICVFLERVGNKFSIKEKPYLDGMACVFFDEKHRNCGIYEYRPNQCRTFPFWEYFKEHKDELEKECIGVKF
ncbi:YkgJ family cysteine cluster protein [Campylobacter sp. JMF_06 NA1]|nr:YkgJ family cysteine cluster protein [Campylobacter sp. JMF_06 NA1]MDA3078083.1 YkgJ family cysteine cluster protein [Campylobacter sp. JMF_06 NA1]